MDRFERIVAIHKLLTANRMGVTNERLMEEACCSSATLKRDLKFLRDALGAPLVLEGDPVRRWRYVPDTGGKLNFHLPGFWLDADELYAILVAMQLTQRSDAGLLSQALGPLQPRLAKMLGDKVKRLDRLRVMRTQARRSNQSVFRVVTEAVLEGRQLRFEYHARSTLTDRERLVSPQQLTHHRENWYLDAWDAKRGVLVRYAVDRIRRPEMCAEAAIALPAEQLAPAQEAGYGIFAGPVIGHATIRFSAHAARWVADETWHPNQRQRLLEDGCLELTVPYANSRELLMDVSRYGKDAEVLSPPALRKEMRGMLVEALGNY